MASILDVISTIGRETRGTVETFRGRRTTAGPGPAPDPVVVQAGPTNLGTILVVLAVALVGSVVLLRVLR